MNQETLENKRKEIEETIQEAVEGREVPVAQIGGMTGRRTVKEEVAEIAVRKLEKKVKIQRVKQSHLEEDQRVTGVVMRQGKRKSQIE